MKINKLHQRITKIMKIIEFHVRINKKNKNQRIAIENQSNHEINIILYAKHENHENHRIPLRITNIMKIIDFHQRITKIMKII